MSHLKRLLAPGYWRIPKKAFKWTVSPSPGPHPADECIPLLIVIRDLLHLAETGKEAKAIIKKGEVLVDGKPRKDQGYPVGIFDVISIPKIQKHFRVIPFKDGLKLIEIKAEESDKKIVRINNITAVKGGKLQLNLNDGKNILVEKKLYSTGDSLLLELPSLRILQHIPLKEGVVVIATKGKMSGKLLTVKKITEGKFKQPSKLICDYEGKEVEVLKEHAIAVGEKEPLISIE